MQEFNARADGGGLARVKAPPLPSSLHLPCSFARRCFNIVALRPQNLNAWIGSVPPFHLFFYTLQMKFMIFLEFRNSIEGLTLNIYPVKSE